MAPFSSQRKNRHEVSSDVKNRLDRKQEEPAVVVKTPFYGYSENTFAKNKNKNKTLGENPNVCQQTVRGEAGFPENTETPQAKTPACLTQQCFLLLHSTGEKDVDFCKLLSGWSI